jgi:20S proteasome alpha/beta subunit
MMPKHSRERRRRVTLIAGMVCRDGIVIAADSEQSNFYRKSNVPKLESYDAIQSLAPALAGISSGSSLIIAGAGNGELADYASHKIVKEAPKILSDDDVETSLENILSDIFGKRFPVYKADDLEEFRLLIAIKAPDTDRFRLFSTYGPTVVERKKFVLGSGVLVDYVLDQIYDSSMATDDGVAAALLLLGIAKKYVNGVGGDSKVGVLSKDGSVRLKPSFEVTDEENILARHSKIANTLMLAMMRTRTETDNQWDEHLKQFCEEIRKLREEKKQSDQKIKDLMAWWNNFMQQQEESREREKSKKLPYILQKPAKNLFGLEGNVFTGKSVPNARFVSKLAFKQA